MDKKGATNVLLLIIVVVALTLGTVWAVKKYGGGSDSLTITQGQDTSGNANVGSGKLGATLTFTTDEKYAPASQPACQSSLFINGVRASNTLTEGATYSVTPGQVIDVYYCSNQTAATGQGWYGVRDVSQLVGNVASLNANEQACSWASNGLTIAVSNDPPTSQNPATRQTIGAGGNALFHVTARNAARRCFSTPDQGYTLLVFNYNSTAYSELSIRGAKVTHPDSSIVTLGDIQAGAIVPVQHRQIATTLATKSFKFPIALMDTDKLEFDIFVQAAAGQDPQYTAGALLASASLNGTFYDTDWYPDTVTGATSGPAPQDNVGTDLGTINKNSNISISII